jgi:BirA family transcriptional regulator, biotin operon repressor / biotin---[acetyl-CoA-carboxylase] ligase
VLRVLWYPSVTSTMDVAAEAVRNGAAAGVVIVADEQTAGRGRLGHLWSSPPRAGLYISLILRPPIDGEGRLLALLTLATGVGVHDAIAAVTGLRTELKWPNDVMIGRRKLAGILAEGSALGTPDQAIVVGIGINILRSAHPPEVAARATSIEGELSRRVDRETLLESVLALVTARYSELWAGEGDGILRAWREIAPSAQGARVEIADTGTRGVTAGIDAAGALLVDTGRGIERVIAGELKWL